MASGSGRHWKKRSEATGKTESIAATLSPPAVKRKKEAASYEILLQEWLQSGSDEAVARDEGASQTRANISPTDWSLKMKAKFTSHDSFEWCSADEVPQQEFISCLRQYIYPDDDLVEILQSLDRPLSVFTHIRQRWATRLQSLCHLYKIGKCPYFYVVGPNFVVLFLLKDFNGIQSNRTVYITPTTTGLRKTLKSEGISFTMPLAAKDATTSSEGDTGDDSDDEFWRGIMEEVVTPTSSAEKPLIKVENESIGLFSKFLLNYETSRRGMLATLVAPVPFEGGTFRSLKYEHRKDKQCISRSKFEEVYSLEVTGMIMPEQLTELCKIIAQQNGDYKLTTHIHSLCKDFVYL